MSQALLTDRRAGDGSGETAHWPPRRAVHQDTPRTLRPLTWGQDFLQYAVAVVLIAAFSTGILVYLGYKAPWSPVFVGAQNDQIPALASSTYQHLDPQAKAGAILMHDEGCLACHTVNGVGGQRGPDLSKVAERVTRDELTTRILNGGGGMPAYGNTIS